jgi:hypothetical protein
VIYKAQIGCCHIEGRGILADFKTQFVHQFVQHYEAATRWMDPPRQQGSNQVDKKGNCSLVFDIVIDTPKGAIFAMYLKCNTELASAATNIANKVHKQAPVSMMIKQAHERFGHANQEATCKAASHLGIKITCGTLKVCEACARAKAKQKNVNKYNVRHKLAF